VFSYAITQLYTSSKLLRSSEPTIVALKKFVYKYSNDGSFVWDDSKPYLIMHIGPSKTGTKTIQKDSVRFTDVLALDGYIYGGIGAIRGHRKPTVHIFDIDDCLYETAHLLRSTNNKTMAVRVPCWRSRMSGMKEFYPKNFVLSEEMYSYKIKSKKDYDALKIAFKDWNLLFVATYRRYAEWLLSTLKEKFFSKHKFVGSYSTWKTGRCENKWQYIQQFLYKKEFRSGRYYNIDQTTLGMKAANVPYKILNFHDKRHITSALYCDIIPNTPKTCQHSLTQESVENAKMIMSSTCSNIAYDAQKAGLINATNQTRHQVNMQCEYFMNANNITHADLPLLCPTQAMLEKLLQKSLAFEQMILPDFFASDRGEAEHNKSFWIMAHERKEFCDVNTKKLLKGQSSWIGVLNSMTFKNWTMKFIFK